MSVKRNSKALPVGTRVLHRSGRLGTIMKFISPHNGYRVALDPPRRQFEGETVRIIPFDLTPLDPELHRVWEARWPSFTKSVRKWANLEGVLS
jgi:hypothetical protein